MPMVIDGRIFDRASLIEAIADIGRAALAELTTEQLQKLYIRFKNDSLSAMILIRQEAI